MTGADPITDHVKTLFSFGYSQPLGHHFQNLVRQPKRLGHPPANAGVLGRGLGAEVGNIFVPMLAGQKEIREHDYISRAFLDCRFEGISN